MFPAAAASKRSVTSILALSLSKAYQGTRVLLQGGGRGTDTDRHGPRVDGELVMRAYTPTSSDDDMGHFDLVIKV